MGTCIHDYPLARDIVCIVRSQKQDAVRKLIRRSAAPVKRVERSYGGSEAVGGLLLFLLATRPVSDHARGNERRVDSVDPDPLGCQCEGEGEGQLVESGLGYAVGDGVWPIHHAEGRGHDHHVTFGFLKMRRCQLDHEETGLDVGCNHLWIIDLKVG